MKAQGKSNPSLWWQLSWQLSIVVSSMIAVVIVGLCVYGVMKLSPNIGLWNDLSATLDESLSLDPQKGLVITEGPALRALKAKNETLWFVVSTPDGHAATFGTVPAVYAELARYVHLMTDADIRGGSGISEVASAESIETTSGPVRIMFGGTSNARASFLTLLAGTYPIYVPLLAVLLPAVFFSVPHIVRRALAGLSSVVKKAPEIDPRRPGSKLPVEDVPREVVPLIVSFNSILERLEEQFQARQRFLIDAAHELRTPIAIMQTRIEGLPGPDQQRLMGDVARLGETAEQLLAFERNDQVNDRREVVDLVDIARTVVAEPRAACAFGRLRHLLRNADRKIRHARQSLCPAARHQQYRAQRHRPWWKQGADPCLGSRKRRNRDFRRGAGHTRGPPGADIRTFLSGHPEKHGCRTWPQPRQEDRRQS